MLLLTVASATNSGGKVSDTIAIFNVVVGLLVLFLIIVGLLRIAFRGPRKHSKPKRSSLDLDAWRVAGDRAEGLGGDDQPLNEE